MARSCSIALDELELWFKLAKPGDIAFHFDVLARNYWIYGYRETDCFPCWNVFHDKESTQKYIDDFTNIGEVKMEKRCDNCKYFGKFSYKDTSMASWCDHPDYTQPLVAEFTSCQKHEFKHKIEAPFDNLKFFIKDQKTGELEIKYICEDCGKVMTKPFHWQFRVPFGSNKDPDKRPGYYYWCEDCWEKEKKK